jgi:hypothetical protein
LTIIPGTQIMKAAFRAEGTPVLGGRVLSPTAVGELRYIDENDLVGKRVTRTIRGDVVFVGIASHLHAIVIEEGGQIVATPAQIIRVNEGIIDPYALAALLQSSHNQHYARGVSARHVNVRDLTVPLVPLATQEVLAQAWRELNSYQARLRRALEATRNYKQILVDAAAEGWFEPTNSEQPDRRKPDLGLGAGD